MLWKGVNVLCRLVDSNWLVSNIPNELSSLTRLSVLSLIRSCYDLDFSQLNSAGIDGPRFNNVVPDTVITCRDYETHASWCDFYGDRFPHNGLTARIACCVCGGGGGQHASACTKSSENRCSGSRNMLHGTIPVGISSLTALQNLLPTALVWRGNDTLCCAVT